MMKCKIFAEKEIFDALNKLKKDSGENYYLCSKQGSLDGLFIRSYNKDVMLSPLETRTLLNVYLDGALDGCFTLLSSPSKFYIAIWKED